MINRRIQHSLLFLWLFLLGYFAIQLSPGIAGSFPLPSQERAQPDMYAPSPGIQGEITANGRSIFWYLHVTDTQNTWGSPEREQLFERFFNTTFPTIGAKFVINTGDLVDSDYSGLLHPHLGQIPSEWETYNLLLTRSGMNTSNYYDVCGNHDCYNDPGNTWYNQYSMQKKIYHDYIVNLNTSEGMKKYFFVGLHTPEDRGLIYPFSLFGHLNRTELDWYEQVLEANKDAAATVVYGHHPAYEVREGGSRFFSLNREYGVDLYLTGHGHDNNYEPVDNRMVSYETSHLTSDGNNYRIMAYDNDAIATSTQFIDVWPAGVITSPVDHHNVYEGYSKEAMADVSEIRVLAWDPNGNVTVDWRYTEKKDHVDSWSEWRPMTHESGPLFVANGDTGLADGKKHLIEARITGPSGEKVEKIEYCSEPRIHLGWWLGRPLIIVGAVILVSLPFLKASLRQSGKINKKEQDEIVDRSVRNLILLKLIILLCIPLVFAPIWTGEVVAVFSLLYWRVAAGDVAVYSVNLMIGGFSIIFGVIAPLGNLSPRKRYWMSLTILPLDLIGIGLLLYFYITVVGIMAVAAPGYYALITCDIMLYKREIGFIKGSKQKMQGT